MSPKSIAIYAMIGVAAAYAHEAVDRSDGAAKERAEYLTKNPPKAGEKPSDPPLTLAKRYGAAAAAAVVAHMLLGAVL